MIGMFVLFDTLWIPGCEESMNIVRQDLFHNLQVTFESLLKNTPILSNKNVRQETVLLMR